MNYFFLPCLCKVGVFFFSFSLFSVFPVLDISLWKGTRSSELELFLPSTRSAQHWWKLASQPGFSWTWTISCFIKVVGPHVSFFPSLDVIATVNKKFFFFLLLTRFISELHIWNSLTEHQKQDGHWTELKSYLIVWVISDLVCHSLDGLSEIISIAVLFFILFFHLLLKFS